MEDGHKFKSENIPEITLQLLIDSFAFQQAAISIIIEHLNLPDSEKNDIINEIFKEKMTRKEQVISSLYASFGKTPDV